MSCTVFVVDDSMEDPKAMSALGDLFSALRIRRVAVTLGLHQSEKTEDLVASSLNS